MGNRRGMITELKGKDGKPYKPKRWQVRASLGFNPVTGKRRQIKETVEGTRKQAEQALERIYREHETGLSIEASRMTFGEYAQAWHKRRAESGNYAAQTLTAEAIHIRNMLPLMGNVKLKDVTALIVENALAELKANKGGKPRSGTTMRRNYQTLHAILKDAVRHDAIMRNPCDKVDAPRIDTKEKKPLSAEQAHALSEAISRSISEEEEALNAKESRAESRGARFERTAVRGVGRISRLATLRLGLATGIRIGEALALRWSDIGDGGKTVTISRAVTNKGVFKCPKTKKSNRTITLDGETARILANLRKAQFFALRSLGVSDFNDLPICCTDVGGYDNISHYHRWLRAWQAENGLEPFHFHTLRHTHATLLLASSIDVKTVQARLGHSTASTTLNIYAHAIPSRDSLAAETMDALLNGRGETARERWAI